jgi:hypothetical protein
LLFTLLFVFFVMDKDEMSFIQKRLLKINK